MSIPTSTNTNQINLTPITQFIQHVRAAELSQAKEVKINMHQARLISLALSEIQDKLIQDYEELLNSIKHKDDFEVINVIVDGGSLENK